MADASGSIPVGRIELLTGPNYYIWALKVGAILRSRRLYKPVIEGKEPPVNNVADSPAEKARIAWEEKNDDAFGIIIITLSPEQAGMFIGERSAKKVWDELKRIHAGNMEDRRIDTALELKNIKMGNETVDEFITRARNIATRSASMGQRISDREIVYYIVRGVHPKLENAAAVLRPQRSATLEEVQQALREEESRLNESHFRQKTYMNNPEKAYKARDRREFTKPRNDDRKCYNCGKVGHIAKICWYGREGERGQSRPKTEVKYGTRNYGNRNTGNRRQEQVKMASTEDHVIEHAFSATSNITSEHKYSTYEGWTLDSGCTSHMSPRLDWITEQEPLEAEINVAEKGRSIRAEAKGNVKLCTQTSEGIQNDVCVQDVLYVPKLRTSLLSIGSLLKKGNKVLFENDEARIFNKENELIAEAREKDRMYVLETKLRKYDTDAINCLTVETSTQVPIEKFEISRNKELWHKRLGHLNENYMENMEKHKLVKGLEYEKGKLGICEPCIMGKISQIPFKNVKYEVTTRPLQLIHMDLCGPMPCVSIGGARYMYVLVDSYTHRYFTYFLKTKNEALEKFVEFKNRRENEKGTKINTIRSDNGTEFLNKEFDAYLKKEGIHHQMTTIYAPSSNGMAERANRSLLEKARTLLIDSQLPLEFWAEAVATATYQKNCSPSTGVQGKIPMELWGGKTPTVTHMRVFGCVAYYYVPTNLRHKLDSKAKKGIFVGYSLNRKAYRIYDPSDKKLHEARTVKFDEQIKGAILLMKKDYSDLEVDHLTYEDLEIGVKDIQIHKELENINHNQITLENDNDQIMANNDNQQVYQRPGRKPGDTNEIIRERHEVNLRRNEEQLLAEGARRSERLIIKNQANVMMEEVKEVPKRFDDIEGSSNQLEWEKAMDKEKESLDLHKVWELVPRKEGMKVMKCKWVYSIKENPDGTINKRKARLVAMGYNQRTGLDYEESFSPVVRLESFRILMAIVAHMNLKFRQYDIKTAYLNGELKESLFMEQPKGYACLGEEDKVCKLLKSIYGLPQSGRNWNEKLDMVLVGCGLKRLKCDPCMYIKREKEELYILGIYVDDIIIVGTKLDGIEKIIQGVKENFEMTERSGEEMYIGIEINKMEGIELSQKRYVNKILEKFGLKDCKSTSSPADPKQDLDNHTDSSSIDRSIYQEMMGSLMYLANGTRPDIAHSVSRLSQYNKAPKQMHLTAVKRVYRYLQGTKDYVLKYPHKKGNLNASTDSSWSSTAEAKAFEGYIVKLGEAVVGWKCKKQRLVALSTCEAEMMAICEGVREIKWVTGLLSELGLLDYIQLPIVLHTDSKAAMDWFKSSASLARTKHVNRKYHYIKDELLQGNIKLEFVKSEDMEADFLTKPLSGTQVGLSSQRLGLGQKN